MDSHYRISTLFLNLEQFVFLCINPVLETLIPRPIMTQYSPKVSPFETIQYKYTVKMLAILHSDF